MMIFNKISQFILFLMLFSPVLSFITFGIMGKNPITYYFGKIFWLYGLIFIFFYFKKFNLPKYSYYLLAYIIYVLIWTFFNGIFERSGWSILTTNVFLYTYFIIIIINNTYFTDKFIHRSILILKFTVIISAIASVIQVVNYNFMNEYPFWAKGLHKNYMSGSLYIDRRSSIFGFVDLNELGLSYMPLLSILIGILLYKRDSFYYIYLILGGITAFLSNSRYVMISFILITFQIFVYQKRKMISFIKYIIIIAISGILFIYILSSLGYHFDDWYHSRLLAEGSITETTRYKAFGNFLNFFHQKVIFGFGGPTKEITAASNAIGSSQIHVGYLAGLVYYGIVGCFFLFGFWVLLAKKLYQTAKLTNYWGSFFAFTTFLWANTTLVTFHIFFYGIFFALIFDKYHLDTINIQIDNKVNKS